MRKKARWTLVHRREAKRIINTLKASLPSEKVNTQQYLNRIICPQSSITLTVLPGSKLKAKSWLQRGGHGSGPWSSSGGVRTHTGSSLAEGSPSRAAIGSHVAQARGLSGGDLPSFTLNSPDGRALNSSASVTRCCGFFIYFLIGRRGKFFQVKVNGLEAARVSSTGRWLSTPRRNERIV